MVPRTLIHYSILVLVLAVTSNVGDDLHAGVVNWYRFDKTDNNDRDVADLISGVDHGVLVGATTTRSSDRPSLSDDGVAISNAGSVSLGGVANEGVLFDAINFILHGNGPAGDGNAALEFVVKPKEIQFMEVFWTNTEFAPSASDPSGLEITGHPDRERFNLQHNTFGGFGDAGFNGDFRNVNHEEGPALDLSGVGGLTLNEWTAMALSREKLADGNYLWRWYVEGLEMASGQTGVLNPEPLPLSPPAGGGQPNGDYNGNGRVDAIDYTFFRNFLGEEISLPNGIPNPTTPVIDQEDYDWWKMHFGNEGGDGGPSAGWSVGSRACCFVFNGGIDEIRFWDEAFEPGEELRALRVVAQSEGASGSVTVPEPFSLSLLCLSLIALIPLSRRR